MYKKEIFIKIDELTKEYKKEYIKNILSKELRRKCKK
jgi:hypothetical protein